MKPSDLVKVKALEWDYLGTRAYGLDGVYCVRELGTRKWEASLSYDYDSIRIDETLATIDDAKAACQAHYESMIYELLEVR